MKLLLTGYSGFVGSNLYNYFKDDYEISLLGRKIDPSLKNQFDINKPNDFEAAFDDVDIVIHSAGISKSNMRTKKDIKTDFLNSNINLTIEIAKKAKEKSIKKFIYISSLKVNGEKTTNQPFFHDDPVNPQDEYAISKAVAEKNIQEICKESIMSFTIIRPPIIYGREVESNFKKLLNLVDCNLPVPFAYTNNKRSFIYIKNLTSFINECITNEAANNKIFLVSDNCDISTYELINLIAKLKNKNILQFYFPKILIKLTLMVLNKSSIYDSLYSSFNLDLSHTIRTLKWSPPYTLKDGIEECI